jgi:hypothetical protein
VLRQAQQPLRACMALCITLVFMFSEAVMRRTKTIFPFLFQQLVG